MLKVRVFIFLLCLYAVFSFTVYTKGTDHPIQLSTDAQAGKKLFQEYNCVSCHQVYGLGGYLGPELTTAWSDPARGPLYIRAFLQAGGRRMPNFHFNDKEMTAIESYLQHIDSTATTYKKDQK